MRDFQFWIYLIIGILYLINRARKKAAGATPVDAPEPKAERRFDRQEQPQAVPQKGLTFEELLREITEAKAPAKPVFQTTKSEYVDYDDDLKEEEQDLEDVSGDYRKKDTAFYNTYEEAKRQAFNRPSLEDTLKLKDTDMTFGKFKVFEEDSQSNLLNDYLKALKDPDGFKKAFVLSEVLQRRY
jgi:hypothetical protein